MSDDLLQRIQTLQFSDRAAAQNLLLEFVRATFPLDVRAVELRPLAVSLNSFNGFLKLADGSRLFFKTHTEPDGVIGEYYHAGRLAEAGYSVLQPLYSSTEAGKQLLIYEVIDDPSVFDVAWEVENGRADLLPLLTRAQNDVDDHLLETYRATLEWQLADDAARAPVHQLFYHRLAGERLERFYNPGVTVNLPDGPASLGEVRQVRWRINGRDYHPTLDNLIKTASDLLTPAQAGPSIIGHGDAHNGNLFFRHRGQLASLLYFDPAFAGRHHPLLDLTKPLFHNAFAMWMYFPEVKRDATRIALQRDPGRWTVEHDYAIPEVRQMFLHSKSERVLIPTLLDLKARGWLRPDWRAYLKAALFCCPFLTMNLADNTKFPPEISLLGLTMAVEMGAESNGERGLMDRMLDEVERAL